MSDNWYYAQGSQRQGPVPMQTLQAMLANGQIASQTLVWNRSMTDWLPAEQAPGLLAPAAVVVPESTMATSPEQYPAPAQLAYASPIQAYEGLTLSRQAIPLMAQAKPWMRFLAVLGFIFAGICILGGIANFVRFSSLGRRGTPAVGSAESFGGLFQVLMGVFYLVPSSLLNGYANRIGEVIRSPHPAKIDAALLAQKNFWRTTGILVIVLFVLVIVLMIFMILAVAR